MIYIFLGLCFQTNTTWAEESAVEGLYETAFKLIVDGNYGEAYERLDEVIAQYPGTVYARFAEERKGQLERLNLLDIRRKQIDQSGQIGTVVFSTLYSTWLGIGTARLIDHEDGKKAVAAGMMIGAPAGLLTSLILTQDAKLTRGQSALINFSGYWGTWQGLGWAILIDEDEDEKTLIRSAMAGGLLGILTTSVLTRRIDLSLGDASIINYGALWGTWLSFSAGIVANVEDGDKLLAGTLVGGNLGATVMASLSPKIDISLARANLINLGGIVGTLVASGVLLITQPETEESAFAVLMGGGIAGLIAGIRATRDFAPSQISPKANERLGGHSNSAKWNVGPHALQMSPHGVRANIFSLQF